MIAETTEAKTDWKIVAFATVAMMVEGYDLVIYGNTIPFMLADDSISIAEFSAGMVGSMVFFGMLLGGICAGAVVKKFGSRATLTWGIGFFSAAMLICSIAPSALVLGVMRFLAGLGLGVVMPTAMALARGATSQRNSPLVISVEMSGFPLGGICATAVAKSSGHLVGWRLLFALACLFGAVMVCLAKVLVKEAR